MGEQIVILDKHGDTRVQLQTNSQLDTTVYIACSRALARASPVLRSEIRQNLVADDTPELPHALHDSTLQIHGSNDDSLPILLNIAHAHFLAVPRTLTISQLYNLTVLTSWYHCTSLLLPWADAWIAGIQGTAVRTCDLAMMLWVFWALDFKDDVRKIARRMAVELDAPEFAQGVRLWGNTTATAASILDCVYQARLRSLRALFQVAHDMLEKLLVLEESPRWSRLVAQLGPKRCRQATRALLTSSLYAVGLWPLPEVLDVQESVAEVYSKLVAVSSHDHMGCEFGLFWCKKMQDALNAQLGGIETLCDDDNADDAEQIS